MTRTDTTPGSAAAAAATRPDGTAAAEGSGVADGDGRRRLRVVAAGDDAARETARDRGDRHDHGADQGRTAPAGRQPAPPARPAAAGAVDPVRVEVRRDERRPARFAEAGWSVVMARSSRLAHGNLENQNIDPSPAASARISPIPMKRAEMSVRSVV